MEEKKKKCKEVTVKLTDEQLKKIAEAFGEETAKRLARLNLLSASDSFIGVILN
ncbi:MAG: hypothetical protein IT232_09640 [Flavobacteriales bacterium]|nr:hypothetical protein [Flavobacteriales bacterium]MCC7332857.1 hypothetical protein [Flavobacteriales bacterium]